MKKQAINLSWPAKILDFSKDTVQENFSRGKLLVFYKGETDDHRFFSDSFSENLVKSLPYTPIVSYYDEEKEDFVGHATEQQILGIVDPCCEPTFEQQEDGNIWCVTDCVFYTERPDKVGELAKKIVGHKQSLELDPNSVQYKINYDEKKHFKNIEFTAGKFVGVSVLGNDQRPAFSGSAFFSCDEAFEEKMELLREYCENRNGQVQDGGSNKMDLQEFMKLSWGEISTKVEEAIKKEYINDAYGYVVDMFEDSAIVRFYYYVEDTSKLMKINYSCDESGNVVLGNVKEVRITYEEVQDSPKVETIGVENATNENDELIIINSANASDNITAVVSATSVDSSDNIVTVASATENENSETIEVAEVSNAEITEIERVVSDGNEQVSEETNTSSASFTNSERAEFETLKREKKINILDTYKEILSEEEYNDFLNRIDSFEDDNLEFELLKIYKNAKDKEPKTERAFAFAPILNNANNNNNNAVDSFIRNNL